METKEPKSGIYADGSFGLRARQGRVTMRVWFCGDTRGINQTPCVHLTREEARACAGVNQARRRSGSITQTSLRG